LYEAQFSLACSLEAAEYFDTEWRRDLDKIDADFRKHLLAEQILPELNNTPPILFEPKLPPFCTSDEIMSGFCTAPSLKINDLRQFPIP